MPYETDLDIKLLGDVNGFINFILSRYSKDSNKFIID